MDLTPQKGANSAIQTFTSSFYLPYGGDSKYTVKSTLSNIGSFEAPEFVVGTTVDNQDGKTSEDFCYRFFRRIETPFTNDYLNYEPLTTGCSENPGIDDKPFENIDASKFKSYSVTYKVDIFLKADWKDGKNNVPLTSGAIKYSASEPEDEKKKFPVAVIIVIVIVALLIAAAVILLFILRNKKKEEKPKTMKIRESNNKDNINSPEREKIHSKSDLESDLGIKNIVCQPISNIPKEESTIRMDKSHEIIEPVQLQVIRDNEFTLQ